MYCTKRMSPTSSGTLMKKAAGSHGAFVPIQLTRRRHIAELRDPSVLCR